MKKPSIEKPTQLELDAAYEAIKKINMDRLQTYGPLAGKGPFLTIGEQCEMSQQQVKYILKGNVKKWKAVHFKLWKLASVYVNKS